MELILLTALLGTAALIGLIGGGSDDGDAAADSPSNSGPDVINGTDGDDRIEAGAGDDIVNGGAGNDTIFLGIGSDTANGGPGEDRIFGNNGADTVTGGPGDDQIFLEGGNDESTPSDIGGIPQDGGNDIIRGGTENDIISDRYGANELYGEEGADTLRAVDFPGDDTPDLLFGGFGADLLIGDDGDIMEGGAREDDFVAVFDESGDSAVTITDLDRLTETLTFQFERSVYAPNPGDPDITTADITPDFTTSPGDIILRLDGTPVAVLEGQTVYLDSSIIVQMI
ncbi:MAG: hypothetical protein HKN02_05395 [Rhodobacteraceae bacterium]|nr:hypothetical protein [Paracoccaceae bacterium]